MSNYYAEKLNSMKLFQVYDTKIDRVKQYFREELNFVRRDLHGYERVLELGCGYGRIMKELAPNVGTLVGIDISPLKGKEKNLIDQSLKVLVPGGKAYFSTYSAKFWNHRVAWFQEQADKGLLGELDMEKTKNGHIECKDGFVANTYTFEDFQRFAEESGCRYKIEEVDESSLFLVLQK